MEKVHLISWNWGRDNTAPNGRSAWMRCWLGSVKDTCICRCGATSHSSRYKFYLMDYSQPGCALQADYVFSILRKAFWSVCDGVFSRVISRPSQCCWPKRRPTTWWKCDFFPTDPTRHLKVHADYVHHRHYVLSSGKCQSYDGCMFTCKLEYVFKLLILGVCFVRSMIIHELKNSYYCCKFWIKSGISFTEKWIT